MLTPTKTLAILGLALLLLPAAGAQVQDAQVGAFGTIVKVGDDDYVPLVKRASSEVRVMVWESGHDDDSLADNCVLLIGDSISTYAQPLRTKVIGQALQPREKDIRITPCMGRAPGTAITGQEERESQAAYIERAVEVRYADVNEDGRYGRSDHVYLGTRRIADQATATLAGAASRGLDATRADSDAAMGPFTIRLTPVGNLPAGSFVRATDPDFKLYGDTAAGAFVPQTTLGGVTVDTTPQSKKWSVVEREGNNWYVVPESAGNAAVAKAMTVPVASIRIGLVGVLTPQPNVIPTKVELANPDGAEAGKPLPVIVTLGNSGGARGVGLLVTKLDKHIVDARMSPVLNPGETTKLIVTIAKVPYGGAQELEVNDVFLPITVAGDAPTLSFDAASEVDALRAQLAAMEARLASFEAAEAKDAEDDGLLAKASPNVAPLAAFGLLLALVTMLRRQAH